MSAVGQIRAAVAACETLTLEQLGLALWRAGLPARAVRLPSHWWQQPTSIEAGVWIARSLPAPERWWLVQQRGDQFQLSPLLQAADPSLAPPPPADLGLDVLSVWPALPDLPGPGPGLALHGLEPPLLARFVVPALILRTVLWLLLPLLLGLGASGLLPPARALVLALASFPPALLLDNRWQRFWLNCSERQRALLGLNAVQRLLGQPLAALQGFGGAGGAALGGAVQTLGELVPQLLAAALPALALGIGSALALLLWCGGPGWISVVLVLLWLGLVGVRLRPTAAGRIQQDRHRSLALQRGEELLALAPALRLAGAEQRALAWWQEPERAAQRLQLRLDRADWLLALAAVAALAGALAAAELGLAAVDPARGVVTLMLVGLQLGSAWRLAQQLRHLQRLVPLWTAGQRLMASPREWQPTALDPGPLQGELALRQLSFRYAPSQALVLQDVTFTVPAGAFVALVGPSGSGKSTLLRLLLGFATPEQGQVLFDGRDGCLLQQALLRSQIGTVLQDPRLVGGTLFEVIAAGRPISLEQAWQAAEQAGLGAEIGAMPMGLQTLVTAGGRTLSAGQRQRLALARALAGSPRLLLLDEPTSALDNCTQALVLNGLNQLAITRLMVAHRLSTVRQADWIVVLERGRVVQQGRCDQLLAEPGCFAGLMDRQRA